MFFAGKSRAKESDGIWFMERESTKAAHFKNVLSGMDSEFVKIRGIGYSS